MLRGPTIRVPQLKNLLAQKCGKLRLLDVTNTPGKPATGFWKWLSNAGLQDHPDFVAQHLPGATNFDLDAASSKTKLFLIWERHRRDILHQFCVRGVEKGDSVVVYGRGDYGGMLSAARAWYMLKLCGMDNVAVLEGGLAKWEEEKGWIWSGKMAELGGRRAESSLYPSDCRYDLIVRFDDLKFDRLGEVNMLDCRPTKEFGVTPSSGKYLPGSKNVPLSTVIAPNGEMKSEEEIREVLNVAGFDPAKPTYTMCNDETQAPLLGLALEKAGIKWCLYEGGLSEVSERNPSLIKVTGK